MKEAKVYAVNEPPYSHIVIFRRKGFRTYKRRFRSEREAVADRDAFNEKLIEEGAGAVHIGPKERERILAAMRILDGTGMDLLQAAEIARREWRSNKGGKDLQALLVDFLGAKEGQRSARTIENLKSCLRAMLDHTGANRVDLLTRKKIEAWVYHYPGRASQRNGLAAANNFCRWMVRKDILDSNPCDQIERPGIERKEVKLIFSPGEAEAFLRAVESKFPRYAAFYAVLLFAFLRPSEAAGLEGSDLRTKTIRVTKGKMRTRKRRAAPIRGNLRAWLDAYPWSVPTPAYQKLCRGLSPIGWEQDICRHTGISYRLTETDDENKVAREAGNSPEIIYNDYYELTEQEEAERFFSIRPGK